MTRAAAQLTMKRRQGLLEREIPILSVYHDFFASSLHRIAYTWGSGFERYRVGYFTMDSCMRAHHLVETRRKKVIWFGMGCLYVELSLEKRIYQTRCIPIHQAHPSSSTNLHTHTPPVHSCMPSCFGYSDAKSSGAALEDYGGGEVFGRESCSASNALGGSWFCYKRAL